MTSNRKPYAVLFTKENCGPCFKTKLHLSGVIQENARLSEVISTLQVENHPTLRNAYGLDLFPTLIIVDQYIDDGSNDEIERYVGGKAIRAILADKLKEIYTERQLHG